MSDKKKARFDTLAVHAGQEPDPTTGAIMTPIYQTSTYALPEMGVSKGYEYARTGNPTRSALEANLAALEGGTHARCFASGMAAVSTLLMSLLSAGDHIIVSDNVYGGVYRVFETVFRRLGLDFSWVATENLANLESAFKDNTRLVYVESPTNPVMSITDIAETAKIAHDRGVPLIVDNTFMTPCLQRPLNLGADVVVHSTTKYLNGHSDSVGGALVTADDELDEKIAFVQNSAGAILAPFDCFLVLRGTKTLGVRMSRHETNAGQVVRFLESHSKVGKILYPGLASHPGHEVHKKQASGFGGMVSFELESGEAAARFLNRVKLFTLAESLGGVESLSCHPATMTHGAVPEATRNELGITDGLVRLSVGIEDPEDLVDDLDRALS